AEDDLLETLRAEAEAAEIPPIQISPEQGAFIQFFLKAIGARRVIEIGTLGGYSAIMIARALPTDGELITIEVDPFRAQFARDQIERAELSNIITVKIGSALDLLQRELAGTGPYDFAFIDDDKPEYVRYMNLLIP